MVYFIYNIAHIVVTKHFLWFLYTWLFKINMIAYYYYYKPRKLYFTEVPIGIN